MNHIITPMVLRLLRIFFVVGFAVIFGMAVLGQFWKAVLYTPYACFVVIRTGVHIFITPGPWHATYQRLPEWHAKALFTLPNWWTEPNGFLFLPWWLLLSTCGLLTVLIWRLNRRPKVGQGFPVEPTAKPK